MNNQSSSESVVTTESVESEKRKLKNQLSKQKSSKYYWIMRK